MFYPTVAEEEKIVKTNITLRKFEDYNLRSLLSPKDILEIQGITKKIFMSKAVEQYIVRIVNMTRNPKGINLGKYIEWGGSPRASIGLFIASKAEALLRGNTFVVPQHVKDVAHDVLRHRLLLTYEGQAENIKTDDIITEILSKVPVP
jgi:MoxR-like ATPase